MIVVEPLCKDDFWTAAITHVQMLAAAVVKRMYLNELILHNVV
jgi:hypothetical protein